MYVCMYVRMHQIPSQPGLQPRPRPGHQPWPQPEPIEPSGPGQINMTRKPIEHAKLYWAGSNTGLRLAGVVLPKSQHHMCQCTEALFDDLPNALAAPIKLANTSQQNPAKENTNPHKPTKTMTSRRTPILDQFLTATISAHPLYLDVWRDMPDHKKTMTPLRCLEEHSE